MTWTIVYTALFGVGVLIIAGSFFVPQSSFLYLLTLGLLFCGFSLLELMLFRRMKQPAAQTPLLSPSSFVAASDVAYQERAVPYRMKPSRPQPAPPPPPVESKLPQKKHSFFHVFTELISHRAPQPVSEVAVADIKGKATPTQKGPAKKEDIMVIAEQKGDQREAAKLAQLQKFISDALASGFPHEKIREAALKAHWPKDLFVMTFADVVRQRKKKKLLRASIVFLVTLVYLVVLYIRGIFLVPYWIMTLQYASPLFYVGLSFVLLAVIGLVAFRIRKILKRKSAVYKVEEEEHVQEIKVALQDFSKGYRTDLDKLYALVQERKVLRVSEVAKAFGISKEQAEEWGRILKDQDLVDTHYPAVGDMEIRWKSSTSTA